MYHQTAITALYHLDRKGGASYGPISEAAYLAACAQKELQSRSFSDARLVAALRRALGTPRLAAWLAARMTAAKARREARLMVAGMRSMDPHLLADIGITETPFGGQVLTSPEGQSNELHRKPLPPLFAKPLPLPGRIAATALPA